MGLIALGFLLFLPKILVAITMNLYEETFYRDVSDSLAQIAKGKPYCIIAPRVFEKRVGNTSKRIKIREWIVLYDPREIDFRHVIDHAIREKLVFYAREGRSLKERMQLGREIHFGLVVQDGFYNWSFRKRAFLEHSEELNSDSLNEMRDRYNDFKAYSGIATLPEDIDIKNYYCPLLHK